MSEAVGQGVSRVRRNAWGLAAVPALPAVALSLLLAACAGAPQPRVEEPQDGPPASGLRAEDVADATPRVEPLAPYGNHSPYEVFGRKYHVMQSSDGYRERGTASWYGTKFHGRRTSSGEPYDLHLATAAHKALPLPTYAEVVNLDNGRRVIVKINDRGPFKDDRLIDLSYGAALRLGMADTGTARVEVRAIDPRAWDDGARVAGSGATPPPAARAAEVGDPPGLQAGAYGRREGAEELAGRLRRADLAPVSINDSDDLFRVWLGPYGSHAEAESVILKAIELGFERPHRVER